MADHLLYIIDVTDIGHVTTGEVCGARMYVREKRLALPTFRSQRCYWYWFVHVDQVLVLPHEVLHATK